MTTLFLDERGALHQIQNLMREAKEAKIAVAFWGRGAVETLLIGRSDLDVEVVCNLDSGACNPFEIEKLRKLRPHNPVRSDPRLHGKLYWTPHGIVLGSSNASTNGLAVEESSVGWAEANVFSSDPKLIKATLEWFNNRKSAAAARGLAAEAAMPLRPVGLPAQRPPDPKKAAAGIVIR
jgi:hypothetical protein